MGMARVVRSPRSAERIVTGWSVPLRSGITSGLIAVLTAGSIVVSLKQIWRACPVAVAGSGISGCSSSADTTSTPWGGNVQRDALAGVFFQGSQEQFLDRHTGGDSLSDASISR